MADSSKPQGIRGSAAATSVLHKWIVQSVSQRAAAARSAEVPMYLALPESDGTEIGLICAEQLLTMTEAETIDDCDSDLVVAVTGDMMHLGFLKKVVYGLRVWPEDFQYLLSKAISSTEGDANRICRGLVVNLDRVLVEFDSNGHMTMVNEVLRLCQLRNDAPIEWTLCLWTELPIPATKKDFRKSLKPILEFLRNSAEDVPELEKVVPWLVDPGYDPAAQPDLDLLLASLVFTIPLLLAVRVATEGWRVKVTRVGLIKGHGGQSPTGAWVLDLRRDEEEPLDVDEAMRTTLDSILAGAIFSIADDGDVTSWP